MSEARKTALAEMLLALVIASIAVAFFLDSLRLPPPRFDPLGSAALPRWLCGLIVVFCALIAARGVRRFAAGDADVTPAGRGAPFAPRPGLAIATFVLVVLYVLLLGSRRIGYGELTLGFVLAQGALLAGFGMRGLAVIAAIGAVLGYGGLYVFTRILFIDLP